MIKKGQHKENNFISFWKAMPSELEGRLRKAAVHIHFKNGEHVFRENDKYRGVFFVESGYFKWYMLGEDRHSVVIKIFEAGEIAGLPPLFDAPPQQYIANLVSIGKGSLFFWPASTFKQLIRIYPDYIFVFNRYITATVKQLALAKAAVTSKSVDMRVEDYLQSLGASDAWVSLPMPKRQIAFALNTSAETFSRALARLQKQGRLLHNSGSYRLSV
ncbi:MAG TPA: Crp/Fnr family transcriptional regulator [Turneriella sp.]|nr:Crp/Fnr family transcriptional regulator [Turneriella sp.]